jgi:hypothetical protein
LETIKEQLLTGERALFKAKNLTIEKSVFADGESPLKESHNINLKDDIFRWKYPLWYAMDIQAEHITLVDSARSGIWYTSDITITNSLIQAPKAFRRSKHINLTNVELPNAEETLWNCKNITLNHVHAVGNYFAMNSKIIQASDFSISGNYAFDGCEDVEIQQATIISKDAFWNCHNVTVRDSTIIGEYLGWNSENVTFINCTIESNQGLCYMKNVTLENCNLLNTDLAFEYSTVAADIKTSIVSVKNPISGVIVADAIGNIIFDDPEINDAATTIILKEGALSNA